MEAVPVKITLKSILQGTEETFAYEGRCRGKGTLYCITYTDRSDSALTRVRIDAGPVGMTLHRQGAITARMQFDPARTTSVKYRIDAFSSDFYLKTKEYRFACNGSSIQIFLDYSLLDAAGETVSQGCQEMEILFMPPQ